MRIENLYQEQVVNQYSQNSRTTDQESEKKGKTNGKDVFEMSEEVPVMPSETYNDFGKTVKSQMSSETGAEEEAEDEEAGMQMPGMPPMPPKPMEEMEAEEAEEAAEAVSENVNDTVNYVISGISEALGVSESEVFEALKSLQLSPSELLSEEGLASVVSALAGNTTTTEASASTAASASSETTKKEEESADSTDTTDTTDATLSATMASLKELMENALKSLQEKLGMTDDEFEEFLSSSDDLSSSMAEYANGNIRNMGNAYGMQQFMDMMQNQGAGIA